eukprot:6186613-Pleurochrysis_carterae.AAC.3
MNLGVEACRCQHCARASHRVAWAQFCQASTAEHAVWIRHIRPQYRVSAWFGQSAGGRLGRQESDKRQSKSIRRVEARAGVRA